MEELILEHGDMPLDELQHWGIKGMKWGVRRFQNKDGSLTPAGEKRYNQEMEKVEKQKAKLAEKQKIQQNKQATQAKIDKLKAEKAELKAQKKALKDDGKPKKDTGETDEQKRERLLKSVDAKELYENKHLLSYQELNERINRIDTEAKLKSRIVEEKAKTGMEFMDDAANAIGKATNLYQKVDNAYKTVTTSAIGGMVAKKLGIEPPKKEFNIDELWKKRNKLSDKEIQDISQRLSNEKKIQDELNRRDKQAKKDAEEAAKKTKAEAQKQIDEYNRKLYEDIKPNLRDDTTYSYKKEDLTDRSQYVNSDSTNPARYSNVQHYPAVVKSAVTSLANVPINSQEYADRVYRGEKVVADAILDRDGTVIAKLKHSQLLLDSDELQHWGVKGMKWGVRRYQDKDGSLTPTGVVRYRGDGPVGKNKSSSNNSNKNDIKLAKKQAKAEQKAAKEEAKDQKRFDKNQKKIDKLTKQVETSKTMSKRDREVIKTYIDRYNNVKIKDIRVSDATIRNIESYKTRKIANTLMVTSYAFNVGSLESAGRIQRKIARRMLIYDAAKNAKFNKRYNS